MKMRKRAGRAHLWICAGVITMALAACSSGSSGKGGDKPSTTSSSSSKEVDLSAYNGPDAQALKIGTISKPDDKHVSNCKIGFLQAYGGQSNLTDMQQAASDALKGYNCDMIGLDSQLNPQTQVSQFQQLIAQQVKAIILMPVSVSALQPLLVQAKAANIPVISFNMPFDLSQPVNPLITTNVATGQDFACYAIMKTLADARPGSTFAVMGTAIPSDQLQFMVQREQYWGQQLGLKFVGKVDALSDNPNSFTPAIQSIFTKWPDVQNIVSYSDNFSLTAATVAAQLGKTDVHIMDNNGGASVLESAIKSGKVFGTYFVPWDPAGQQMAYAAYLAAAGEKVQQTAALPSKVATQANVGEFTWAK